MVTQPLQVVRASGSIITAEVSLGYDVSHARAAEILCRAAAQAGLKDGFEHVREPGDFSVTYRVAGLLEEIRSLISARSTLRKAMVEKIRAAIAEIESQLAPTGDDEDALDPRKKSALEEKKLRLAERLNLAEQQMKAQELDD